MNFILEQVHSSSIYLSVFVDMIPKWHSFSYKSFCNEFMLVSQSKWNSWSGMKFHSGINVSWNKLCSSLKITNHLVWSKLHMHIWSGMKTMWIKLSWSILSCECCTNFTPQQNSSWNESQSSIIIINSPLELILTLVLARLHVGASLLLISSFPWRLFD